MNNNPTTGEQEWQGGGIDKRNHPAKVKQLEAQLAAERQRRHFDLEDFKQFHHNPIVADLREQLAAERGRAENWKHNSERYEAELAAERLERMKIT